MKGGPLLMGWHLLSPLVWHLRGQRFDFSPISTKNAGCAKKSGVFLTCSAIDLPVFSSTTAKTRRILPAVIFFLIPSCLCHLLNVLLAEITALSVSCSHNGGLDPKAALRSFMQLCKMLSSFLLFFVPVQ